MYNKKVLSQVDLGKYEKPNPYKNDIIVDPRGQWDYPGQNTRIPGGNITMQGVGYPVWAQPNVGPGMMMMPGQDYNFPGADYVDEYPQMKKGGMLKLPKMPKPSKKGVLGKAYSRSLDATNRLFTENKLFEKPKSKKREIFDPNANYQDGGITSQEEINDANRAMMKARLAYADMHGNSAAKRMITIPDNPYQFEDGNTGTHYMASMDNYAVPQIQDENGTLMLGDYSPDSNEAIRFDNPDDAQYFAEHYKEVSPGFIEAELTPEEIQSYRDGGYIVEDISIPKVGQQKFGPGGATDLNPQTMTRYLADLKNQENSNKKGFRNNKWYPHSSVEGGADTIAYGHKLTPADAKYYQGITNEQAEALQQQDVLKKQSEAQTFVDKKYGSGAFDRLPQDAQMLLVDYQYNVGLQKFPSFVDATIKGDKARMMKEYERGSSAGKLVKRNKWTKSIIDNLDFTAPPAMVSEVPPVPLANVADATVVVPQVTPIPLPRINPVTGLKYQTGGDVISENGWDYQREGDQYLARKTGTETWIPAQGNALAAIQEKIYKEPIAAEPSATNDPLPVQSEVAELQKKLKAAGYNLGNFGPNKDGVDGQMGNRTKLALDAFNAGVPPSKVKTPDPKQKVKGQVNVYKVNDNLREGYLPYLNPNEEVCVKGKGCSANVSIKMSNLLGNITDESLWANDAWFNKSDILNKGGDLIYENQERDYSKMQKVPKDVWSKLQVGDYVQLNRTNTNSSNKFAAQSKPGLENEGIEHLGFVVGKDKDGTPLIWHGSETGKAYVQRIDQPLALHDENQISNSNTFTYQVASIVRSPALKNADLSGLQNSAYYTPLDTNKKLVPKKGATSTQVDAIQTLNNSNGAFKNIGYSQDDVNYVGQILIGGIMNNETSAGESNKRVPKEIAATIWKNYLGQGSFEGDEASIGYYQMKPHLNFTNKDGSLNTMGKKLEKLGISIDEIDSDDVNAQTKAGTLLLLNAYDKLKKDKDFNPKTGLYKGKIPASYILAKTWQAGQGWYKRDKYQKYLDNFDVDYSNNALKGAVNSVDFIGSNSPLNKDYYRVNKGIEERNKKIEEAKLAKIRKERAELNKFDPDEYLRSKNQVAESTAVRPIYNQMVPKFDTVNKLDPSKTVVSKTVYTFPGKSGVTYKKDNKGNWYANTGKGTSNKYVPIKDPNGARTKALNSKAIVKAKEGGIVTSLSQNEINNYLRNGYIIEELD